VPNWEKISKDPDFLAIFADLQMQNDIKGMETALLTNRELSQTDRAYKQGILAGIRKVAEFPQMKLGLEAKREEEAMIQGDQQKWKDYLSRRLRPMRLRGGV
jgi:hypothetical protein